MSFASVRAVALGAALGSLLRHGQHELLAPLTGGFPVATLLANLLGTALLAWLLASVAREDTKAHPLWRPFLGIGVAGGYTAFSALELETFELLAGLKPELALAYLVGTCAAGATLARALGRRLRERDASALFEREPPLRVVLPLVALAVVAVGATGRRPAAVGLAAAAVGGLAGSCARFLVSTIAAARLSRSFPWGTLAINVTGCFLAGLAHASPRVALDPRAQALLVSGVLGGYTTFSTFACEVDELLERGERAAGLVYALVSAAGGLAAFAGGRALVS